MSSRIRDIAEYVGLSPATVSMVLNNRPGFSDETRERVMEAARQLNYQPTSTKRSVDQSESLPFVIFKRHGEVVAETPFFASLIEAIEGEAKNNGYNLSIHYLNAGLVQAEGLKSVAGRTDNGILVLATELKRPDWSALGELSVPYVLIDNAMLGVSADKVVIGNRQGAYHAVEELYNCGHRRIGYLHSAVWISNFEDREIGYRLAMSDLGLTVREDWVARVGSTHDTAYEAMLAYCAKQPEMPTAFFADNDIIAMGAMKALRERSYAIPEDISIIGFDDMPYCTMVTPNLTTMRVDTHSMGAVAVKLLLDKNDYRQKVEVETELIRRQSVRRL